MRDIGNALSESHPRPPTALNSTDALGSGIFEPVLITFVRGRVPDSRHTAARILTINYMP
jgi:hypothetical protein